MRGGKLGAFLAGLGFMLPGFVLMLALSVLYVEADIAGQLDELFYGLKVAVGALIARALVRLGRSFITDVPLALIAVAAFALTVFASAGFAIVLLGAGLAYELWTNADRWTGRASSMSPGLLIAAAGSAGLPLHAEIFTEGLKAGLLTFGGAYTVIPFLESSSADAHQWLTAGQYVDGLALSGVLPAPLIILSTFRRLRRRGPDWRTAHDARHLPAGLRVPDLPPPTACGGGGEPPCPAAAARRHRRRDRAHRRSRRGRRRDQRRRRAHSATRRRVPSWCSTATTASSPCCTSSWAVARSAPPSKRPSSETS